MMLVSPRGRSAALWHLCSAIIWSLFVSFLFRCPSKELTWAGRSPFHCALTAEIICSFSPSAVGSLAICKLTYCRFLNLNAWLSYIYMHLHIGLSTSLRCATATRDATKATRIRDTIMQPGPFREDQPPVRWCPYPRTRHTHLDNRLAGCRRGRTGGRAPATTSDMSPTGCKWPRHVTGEPSLLFLIRVIGDSSQLDRLWTAVAAVSSERW